MLRVIIDTIVVVLLVSFYLSVVSESSVVGQRSEKTVCWLVVTHGKFQFEMLHEAEVELNNTICKVLDILERFWDP